MNKISLQNSDNLLCNRNTLFYKKEWEDLKTRDSFSGLVNKCGSVDAAAIKKGANFMRALCISEDARALH